MQIQKSLLEGLEPKTSGLVCGIDEVGRGCLAGPVVAAAVILPSRCTLPVTDSKKLSAKRREELSSAIRSEACAWALGLVGQKVIDRINILQATLFAMSMAVGKLTLAPARLVIDGTMLLPLPYLRRFWLRRHPEYPLPEQQCIVKGDATVPAISAASILAKTYRDALMTQLSLRWPLYGFEQHVGYGSSYHREMLQKYGPCPLHRLSFHGVLPKKSTRLQGSLLS